MGKLVAIKTYEEFGKLLQRDAIDNYALNYILDTKQLYTHGIFINGATFGTKTSDSIQLTIAGSQESLALTSHTHSNYLEKDADIDIGNYKIKSGQKDLMYVSDNKLYIGGAPVYINDSTFKIVKNQTTYDILDTGNFSIEAKTLSGNTLQNVATFKYGGNNFSISYVRRINTTESFDNLVSCTQAGTTKVNNVQYGFLTLYTDNTFNNPGWAQLRFDIDNGTMQYRTSANSNNWISLNIPSLPVNALNTAGIVTAPTSSDGNKVWKTDSEGNPGWRSEQSYTFNDLKFQQIENTDLMTYNTQTTKIIRAGDNIAFSYSEGVLTLRAADTTYSLATDSTPGLVKVGTTLESDSSYTKVHIKDGFIYYHDTTYSFSDLKFQQTSGTDLFTYNSQSAKTILAGDNITFQLDSNNNLVIKSKVYSDFSGSGTNHKNGLVPDPGSTQGTTKFLREDGTWEVPTYTQLPTFYNIIFNNGTDDIFTYDPDGSASKTIVKGSNINFEVSGNTLTISAIDTWKPVNTTQSGYVPNIVTNGSLSADDNPFILVYKNINNNTTPVWVPLPANAFNNTTYTFYDLIFNDGTNNVDTYKPTTSPSKTVKAGSNITISAVSDVITISSKDTWTAWKGATDSVNGTAGYMPAPTSAQRGQFLRGDGSWVSLNNYSLPTASSSTLGGVKTGAAITDITGYTAVAIKDGIIYYKDTNTTYSFSNLQFQQTSGTNLMTYNSQATKTVLAGSNITFTHSNNILTITAKDTTYNTVSKSAAGLCPTLPNETTTTKYLRQDGTWVTPPNDNTTYTFYNLQFQNSGGTTVDTYKPTTSPTKTLKAGSNVTISAASNIITIASTNTWNANAVGVAGYVAAPTKAANANMTWQTDAEGVPAWRASNNHSHSYLPLSGDTMVGNITFSGDNNINWTRNTDFAQISFKNTGNGDTDSYMSFVTGDDQNEYFRFSHTPSGGTNTEWMTIKSDGVRVKGTLVSLNGHKHPYTDLTGSSTTANQAIVSNGTANGWTLKTLGNRAFDSTSYLPIAGNSTSQPMTGTIYIKDVNALILNSNNKDLNIWEVYGNAGAWTSEYGFNLQYKGTAGANDNDLILWAHNQTSTHQEVYRVHQDGQFIFKSTPYVGSTAISLNGHTHSYLPLSGGTLSNNVTSLLILNNSNTATSEVGIVFRRRDTAKAWVGYADSYGVYLYNSTRQKYLNYKDDGSLLFEGNKVWHAGNDGSDSGLDADLLDGNHASAFATSGHNHDGTYLVRTSYDYHKEFSGVQYSYIEIGAFYMYDSMVAVDITLTTTKSWTGRLIISSQNINDSGGGTYECNVRGDNSLSLHSLFTIVRSGKYFRVYLDASGWKKVFCHIWCIGASASELFQSVNSIPQGNITINNPSGTFDGNVLASSFIKSGGTSSQFLKADGSVDSNSYVIKANSDYGVSKSIYSINPCRIFTGQKYTDSPIALDKWVSGIALGSNWDSNHYQAYLVEGEDGRWYTTRAYENSLMKNWKTFAYLSDLPTKSSWNYDDRYLKLAGGMMDNTAGIYWNNTNRNTSNAWNIYTSGHGLEILNAANSSVDVSGPTGLRYGVALHVSGSYWLQLCLNRQTESFWIRGGNTDGVTTGGWKELAYITSNVASATKLQTARTLWGQSFNGTANVSGAIDGVHERLVFSRENWNYICVPATNGNLAFNVGAAGTNQTKMCVLNGGNVGIGTTNPTQKLHVNGSILAGNISGKDTSNTLTFRYLDGQKCSDSDYNLYIQYNQSSYKTFFNGGTYYIQGGQYNGNAASATKLATSRNIWGQSFNGTGNVSGSLSGVSAIELSGVGSSAGHGGFIDFHYNGSTSDYTSRIIEWNSGVLDIAGTNLTVNGNPVFHANHVLQNNGEEIVDTRGIGIIGCHGMLPASLVSDFASGNTKYNTPVGISPYNWGQVLSFFYDTNNAHFQLYVSDISSNMDTSGKNTGMFYRSGWGSTRRPWRLILDNASIQTYYGIKFDQTSTASKLQMGFPGSTSFVNVLSYQGTSASNADLYVGDADHDTRVNGRNVYLCVDGNYVVYVKHSVKRVGINTTDPASALEVNGDCRATNFIGTSDVRLKDIISYKVPDLDTIAAAPGFLFRWKDPEKRTKIYAGTSAQYWQEVFPNVVHKADNSMGTLAIQYDVLGTLCSISLAREVKMLKEQVQELREYINNHLQ